MGIKENLYEVRETLPENVTLIAVSKTRPAEDIKEAYESGQRDFGENRVQELREKIEELPGDIRWHLIGQLQRNKVKYLDERTYLIHSADREDLLHEIDKNAGKKNYIQDCLLEINIGREENKAGVLLEILPELVMEAKKLKNIRIKGFMTVLPICGEEEQKKYFEMMKDLFEEYKKEETDNFRMEILSMGMSGDYEEAVKNGSNMVRIGTRIFGKRAYPEKI